MEEKKSGDPGTACACCVAKNTKQHVLCPTPGVTPNTSDHNILPHSVLYKWARLSSPPTHSSTIPLQALVTAAYLALRKSAPVIAGEKALRNLRRFLQKIEMTVCHVCVGRGSQLF